MPARKNLVTLNVVSAGSQVLFVGVVYFLLYRFLLKQVGVEMLGVWSVVLSTSSLANLANFGVADSVIRFVALFIKEGGHQKIKQLIFTATAFLGGLFLLIAAIIYPFADLILKAVIPLKFLSAGLQILPFSLGCLVLNSVNGVFASVLDGMQKNYMRTIVFSCSSLMLLMMAYILVPKYHLLGVAFAQLCQSIFALLGCFVLVIVRTKFNPFKWNWNKSIFRQIFNYGMKFQFISIAIMLNDPVTKLLLGKFGGMAFAGYYEMANRVLMQARGVIVNGTQSLIPVMINLSRDIKEVRIFYKKVFSNVLFFSLTAMGILVISGHFIAYYWIGHYQPVFYDVMAILGFSLFINLLNAPAYFYYIAEAELNILIKAHLLIGLSNLLAGYVLGRFFGGFGVVFGSFASVLLGSVYILMIFNKMYNLKLSSLFQTKDIFYVAIIVAIAICSNTLRMVSDLKTNDLIGLFLVMIAGGVYFLKFKFKGLGIATRKKEFQN